MTNEELQALCDAATVPAWHPYHPEQKKWVYAFNEHGNAVLDVQWRNNHWNDAKFIAASRTALPALITELRAARNYIALLEQAAGHVIQEQRSAVYAVYSRPECPFQYCDSPSDCEGRCHHRPQETHS